MVNKLVERTIRISLLIQIITTLISADGFISPVSSEHAILKEILYIETIVQVIEGFFYSHIINGLSDIKLMTPRRYFDWFITTPIMLFSTVLFFKYSELKERNTLKEFTAREFYEENKENVHKMIFYNAAMLVFGYLGETGKINKVIAIPLGFVFFFLSFKLIYEHYATKSKLGLTLFKILFGLWSSYGLAAVLPDVPKNICYNTLDIFSKNFYGLFIYYKIRELNSIN